MFFRKNKYLYAWVGLFLMLVILNACTYTAKATRELLDEASQKEYDMVVVPGVPLEDGKWSRIMKARIYWSKYLYDRGIARNIMYSGSAVYTRYYEAEVMALYAEAIGIDPKHIFTETRAEHSTENIYYSYKKARKLGFNSIALASDPFQSKMLENYVKNKVDTGVDLIPIVFDTLRAMEPIMKNPALNFARAEASNFIPITRRESFWKRFKGTRGGNVDATAYE